MYDLIRTYDSFNQIKVKPSSPVFCDTETCEEEGFTLGGLYGQIRLVQIYQESWPKAIIIDCFFISLQEVLDLLHPHHLIFHNGAYDLHTINLKTETTWLPAEVDDTLYLSRLKFFTKQKFGFYECLKYANYADELINSIDKKEEQKSDWGGPLSQKQKTYAACDVFYLCKLYESVKDFKETTVYKLDIQSLKLAVNYTRSGMPVNRKTVKKFKQESIIALEELLDDLPINPRSSTQTCAYLGSSSSDSEVLETLIQEGNERAVKVRDARHHYKSIGYLEGYDRDNIKGFFQPCAAISGRFSCNGGNRFDHHNLQQIPGTLHTIIEAPEGYSLIYKDYSGLELRMAAAYIGEPVMCQMMINGMDLHTETAKFIFNTESPTKEERDTAKAFNFSLIYGSGIKTVKNILKLRNGIEMSFQETKSRIDAWFDLYEYFREWHNMHKAQLNIYGYVDIETALGRRIRTYKLTDSLNFPIQSSSVEVTKMSLGLLYSRYSDVCVINTIHDSNILLQRTEEAEMWRDRLSECMVEAWQYVIQDLPNPDVPMPHGGQIGSIWTFH